MFVICHLFPEIPDEVPEKFSQRSNLLMRNFPSQRCDVRNVFRDRGIMLKKDTASELVGRRVSNL
jgi:hypothetical protein